MPLPYKDFVWLTEEECATLNVLNADLDSDVGYLLEVDLHYPTSLHDYTSDLPFAPEKSKLSEENFTEFQVNQYKEAYGNQTYPGYEKLLLTLWDKEKYVVHAKLLQYYLQQGMILRKIHRGKYFSFVDMFVCVCVCVCVCIHIIYNYFFFISGIKFTQAPFMEKYISYNSQRRQEAENKFEKDYYKLKNNSVYGKFVENVRRRMNFRLCNTEQQVLNYASNPSFQSSTIFSGDLVGISLAREKIVLDKPVFIGQAVLDLSKLVMYQLRYTHLAK